MWGHTTETCPAAHYWDLPINSHFPKQDLTRILWNCHPGTDQWHFPAGWCLLPWGCCLQLGFKTLQSSFYARRDFPERIKLQTGPEISLFNRREDIIKMSSTVMLPAPSFPVPALYPTSLSSRGFVISFLSVQRGPEHSSRRAIKGLYFPL